MQVGRAGKQPAMEPFRSRITAAQASLAASQSKQQPGGCNRSGMHYIRCIVDRLTPLAGSLWVRDQLACFRRRQGSGELAH